MVLTALEHQKVAALRQVATLVSQAASIAGNQQVLNNIVGPSLAVIQPFESSDPEFTSLAILLRQASVSTSPQTMTDLIAQVNSMSDSIEEKIGPSKNSQGDPVRWSPIYGKVTSPLYDPKEPVRTYSPHGWRGSQKYPFGRAFPDQFTVEGWEESFGFLKNNKILILLLLAGAVYFASCVSNRK